MIHWISAPESALSSSLQRSQTGDTLTSYDESTSIVSENPSVPSRRNCGLPIVIARTLRNPRIEHDVVSSGAVPFKLDRSQNRWICAKSTSK